MKSTKIKIGKRDGKMAVVAKVVSNKPALSKRVARLENQNKKSVEWLNHRLSATTSIAQQYQYNLCNFGAMTPVFGTTTDDLTDNQILYHSFRSHIKVSLENATNNEEETTKFSCFLVSLKDIIPSSRFNNGTGVLSLTADLDYTVNSGVVYLNPKIFNIHKRKLFTLTNYGTALGTSAGQSQYGTCLEWNWDMKIKKQIKSGQGNIFGLASALDPTKQYYMLFFSDNQTGDLESPTVKVDSIHNFIKMV